MPEQASRGRWILVGIGFTALALSFSVRAVLGLSMPVIEAELGWDRAFLSGAGALALCVMAGMAPVMGTAVDRHGPRRLLAGGLLLVAAGAAIIAAGRSTALFLLGFGVVAAVGFTAVGTNIVAAAVARRFTRGRGMATGIATAGATAGQLVLVPLVALLAAGPAWRSGFAALAAACLVLGLAAWVALRGATAPAAPSWQEAEAGSPAALLRSPVFHLLFWSFAICGFTTTGVIETHLLPFAALCGFPPLPSAAAYGVLSAVNLGGMVLAGWLTDQVDRPLLLAVIYLARAASFVLLIGIGSDIRMLYVFAVMFGLFDYATVPVTVSLAASHLGTARLGLAMGLISAGHAAGGALGAFLGGVVFDRFSDYGALWAGSIGLAVLAGLLALALPRRAPQPAAA
ncbi:MFS transporter [Inquilinus limosus]|uniref:MFS transporter n=1 Tax=Inquilinus limosus TaxID=171674 RepID=A0A211ZE48_9PROT|nr:MFS transporter [Inquilinus limosus]OWJ63568.1 MFS transporter [Inquilinus limosus]